MRCHPVLGERGAEARTCPPKVLVFFHLDGGSNGLRYLRRLSEFTMKGNTGVEPSQ